MKYQPPILAASLALASGSVFASGFALIEQSANGQGLSYAGAAANTDNSSVMWFNPAGITDVKGHQVIVTGHYIVPDVEFKGVYKPTLEEGKGNGSKPALVPTFYWKGKAGEYDLGLGINVPFGNDITYDSNWVGRYFAVKTDLKTININPMIARKITPKLSFGFGLNAQKVDLVMTQKVNQTLLALKLNQQYNAGLSTTRSSDGSAKTTADSWGYGYNFGFLYKASEKTKYALGYRSAITHPAKGNIDYSLDPDLSALVVGSKIKSTVTLPASVNLGVVHKYQKIEVLLGAIWTKWSDYKELEIQKEDGTVITNTRQDFKDSWRLSAGVQYPYSEKLLLRTGIAYDQTPISNEAYRSPRTPDADRKWVSIGLGYKVSKTANIDIGYSYLWSDKASSNYTTNDVEYLVGTYTPSVSILSAQYVWNY